LHNLLQLLQLHRPFSRPLLVLDAGATMAFDCDIDAFIQMVTTTAQTNSLLPDPRTQVSVTNLPYHVHWQDLKDLFCTAGTVLRADVFTTANSHCGTVLLATRDGAQRAVNLFSGCLWHGRFLKVQITDAMRDNYVPPVFVKNVRFFGSL
jgi:RNA recognition motif-containing protein